MSAESPLGGGPGGLLRVRLEFFQLGDDGELIEQFAPTRGDAQLDALGRYLDDPLQLFIPVRLLLGGCLVAAGVLSTRWAPRLP